MTHQPTDGGSRFAKDMQELVDAAKLFAHGLHTAALNYLRVGLEILHRERNGGFPPRQQVGVGNLAIATELFLKSYIARQHITLVFKSLAPELQAAFLSPASMPRAVWYPHLIRLRSGDFDLIDFPRATETYFHFRPERREALKVHLDALAWVRNQSLHSVLPERRTYELSRAGFVALEIAKTMVAKEAFSPEDDRFLAEFRAERALKVDKAIKTATQKARSVAGPPYPPLVAASWEELVEPCPICRAPALFRGETGLVVVEGFEGRADKMALEFRATSVECPHCGLKLDDGDELDQAGIFPDGDRPPEDVQRYLADHDSAGTVSDATGRDLVNWQVTTDGPHRSTVLSVVDYRRAPRPVMADAVRQAIDAAKAATPHPVKADDDDGSS